MAKKRGRKINLEKKYELLASLKIKKKEVETKIKEVEECLLQNILIEKGKKANTSYGEILLENRTNYIIPNNNKLIDNSSITQAIFINKASISIGTLKKIITEEEFKKLLNKKILKEKKPSWFFKLQQVLNTNKYK